MNKVIFNKEISRIIVEFLTTQNPQLADEIEFVVLGKWDFESYYGDSLELILSRAKAVEKALLS
jgi:hypothetical protein